MAILFQTKDAARLSGLNNWQVQSYSKQGFVTSAKRSRGAGSRKAYDLGELVKLTVLNRLSEDGFDLRTLRPIFHGMFEIPVLTSEDDVDIHKVREWFADKVLLTCEKFSVRKMVRRDRLSQALESLLPEHSGLYIIDLGSMLCKLMDRVAMEINDE
jgi:DNA-binding transcriptional MerR regulator